MAWTFERIDYGSKAKDGFGYVKDDQGRDILHVGERTLSEAENVAIGTLAAAAPQMFEALRLFERAAKNGDSDLAMTAHDLGRAALAAASPEGKELAG